MIRGLHFLLTYECTYECDHCFSHPPSEVHYPCSDCGALKGPRAGRCGERLLRRGRLPLLSSPPAGKAGGAMGFGIEVSERLLRSQRGRCHALAGAAVEAGLTQISISDDRYHNPMGWRRAGHHAVEQLGTIASLFCAYHCCSVQMGVFAGEGGSAHVRGRAVEAGRKALPPCRTFPECPMRTWLPGGALMLLGISISARG